MPWHGTLHPGGYGQADGYEGDAQDYRRPAEYQAGECQASSSFPGASDLAPGQVAEHDRRDGRQRPDYELRQLPRDTLPASRSTDPTTADRGHRPRPGRRRSGLLVLSRSAKGADLLVVGSRGHGGFASALLGSVSMYCVLHAHCPVLVLRDGREGSQAPDGAESL